MWCNAYRTVTVYLDNLSPAHIRRTPTGRLLKAGGLSVAVPADATLEDLQHHIAGCLDAAFTVRQLPLPEGDGWADAFLTVAEQVALLRQLESKLSAVAS